MLYMQGLKCISTSGLGELHRDVLFYINICIQNLTDKCIPGTSEVLTQIRACNRHFRSDNSSLYSVARANMRRAIKEAKEPYRRKIEDHLRDNTQCMWRGIQAFPTYKGHIPASTNSSALLAEELNSYIAHFEVQRSPPPATLTCSR